MFFCLHSLLHLMQNQRGRCRRGGGPVCAVSGASTSCDDVCGRVAVDANVALTMPVANNTNRQPVSHPLLFACCQLKWKKQWKKSHIRHAVQCKSNSYGSSSAECPRPSPRIIFANFFLFSPPKQQHALYIICTFHLVPKNTKKSTAATTGATGALRMCVGVRVNECVPLPVCVYVSYVCISAYSVNTRINKPPIAGTHLGAGLLDAPLDCHVDEASMPGVSKTESESTRCRMPNKMKCSAKK